MTATFSNKTVWITGGGSGIGLACAREFASRGATIVVSGRREQPLVEAVRELDSRGQRGISLPCDVTDDKSVQGALDRILSETGQLDVVLANAGFAVGGPLERISTEEWRRQLDVNVVGLASTVRYALPHLRQTRGRIGLVASVAAYLTPPGSGAYAASKAAVRAIGDAWSVELAGSGVSCTTIHPGFVESDINRVDNEGVFHPDREDRRPSILMWKTEDAARVMVDALGRREREFVFTAHGKIFARLARHAPAVTHALVKAAARSGKF